MAKNYRFIDKSIFLVRINQQTGAYSVVPDDSAPDVTDLTCSSALRFGYPMTYKSRRVLPFHQRFRNIYDPVLGKYVQESVDNTQNRFQIIDPRTNSIQFSTLINSNAEVGTQTRSYRIVSKGLSAITNLTPGVYDESGTKVFTPSRSYGLVVLDRITQAITFSASYDIYGTESKAKELSDKLNSLDSTSIVIVTTYDEPQTHRTVELMLAMYRCGASYTLFGSKDFQYRSAYVLVGVPGQGVGTGIEFYAGSETNSVDSVIDTQITIDKGVPYPYSSVSTSSESVYAMDYWNKCLYILSTLGKLQKRIDFTSSPYNVSIGKLEIDDGIQDFVAVSLPSENRVVILDPLNNYGIIRDIPTKSYPMGVLISNERLFVCCYRDHVIQKFRVGGLTTTNEDYDTDYGVINIIDSVDGSVFASLYDSNSVFVIPKLGTTTTVRVGRGPLGLTRDPQGSILVTNSTDNTFTKINSTSYHVLGTYDTGNYPSEIACDQSGQTFVLCKEDDKILVYRSSTGEYVSEITIQHTGYGLSKSSISNKMYLSSYAVNYPSRIINPHNRLRNPSGKLGTLGISGAYVPTIIKSTDEDVPKGAFSDSVWLTTSKQLKFGVAEYCTAGEKLLFSISGATPSTTAPDLVLKAIYTSTSGVVTTKDLGRLSRTSVWTELQVEEIVPPGMQFIQFSTGLDYSTSDERLFDNRWYITGAKFSNPNQLKKLFTTISTEPLEEDNSRWNPIQDYGQFQVQTTHIFKASEFDIFVSDGRRNKLSGVTSNSLVKVFPSKQISITELIANTLAGHESVEYNLILGKFNELVLIELQSDLYVRSITTLPRGINLSADGKVLYGILQEAGKFEVIAVLSNNRSLRLILSSKLYRTSAKIRHDQLN